MSEVAKFAKLPVTIEAMQWTGDNFEAIQEWAGWCVQIVEGDLVIATLEDTGDNGFVRADHVASVNDWVIKGIAGEFYFCKPEIFNETYHKVAKNPRKVELRKDGLLWYINRSCLHPRGYAMGIDETTGELSMYGDGKEPFQYSDTIDEIVLKERLDATLERISKVPEEV